MEFKKLELWMRAVELQLWRFGLPKENLDKLSVLRFEFVHDLGFEEVDNGVWIKKDAPQDNIEQNGHNAQQSEGTPS